MKRIPVHFFTEDIDFIVKKKTVLRTWVNQVILNEGYQLKELNFIFCSDDYLLKMNIQYLNHHTYTDVITFDNSEKGKDILGDIFISIDRITENANSFHSEISTELHRVMIHGTLHLLGYLDKTKAQKQEIRNKEDQYLHLLTTIVY